jgi:16S rRNA processing protein RimM
MTKRILIAEIATSHGVKGLVKVRTFAEDAALLNGDLFIEETGDKTLTLKLKNAMKDHWLAEVAGITEKNGADALRGTKLYIDRAALPEADDGEYYIEDLKGMRVVDETGKDIGTVIDVVNYGAGDLLDIKPSTGQSFYVPFTDDAIIDIENKKISIILPEMI